jgi:hypothetical protein
MVKNATYELHYSNVYGMFVARADREPGRDAGHEGGKVIVEQGRSMLSLQS